jgi:serine/threonine-protein kinase
MATVYLARDTKHGRDVALKVLHAEFAASLRPDRFRREVAVAGRLQHPHILAVFDSGETSSGQLWFTMPYVVGESLRDRLRRDSQLSVDDMVRITSSIADALQYAYGHRGRGRAARDCRGCDRLPAIPDASRSDDARRASIRDRG